MVSWAGKAYLMWFLGAVEGRTLGILGLEADGCAVASQLGGTHFHENHNEINRWRTCR